MITAADLDSLLLSFGLLSGSESGSDRSESGASASHSSKMERSSSSLLKSRMPWPRSLMLGFRIHHSRSGALSVRGAFRAKLSWSS